MSDDDRKRREGAAVDADALDEPLVRYAGDAVVTVDGESVDLNLLEDPFSGRLPAAVPSALVEGRPRGGESGGRERVGRRLRALREDNKISKSALAKDAGVSAADLTRAESGDPALGVSLVQRLVRAMGGRLGDVAVPDAPELSMKALIRIGEDAGAPRPLLQQLADRVGRWRFTEALYRAFGWTSDALLAKEPRSSVDDVRVVFKAGKTESSTASPVLALARRMSELAAGLWETPYTGVPRDPEVLRRRVLEASGESDVTLEGLLDWSWSSGIIVLPLARAPEFVAAAWFVGERPVVVLKDSRTFAAYWLFDLAHELGHLAHGHVAEEAIVDVGDPKDPDLTDEQEAQANAYALELLLPDTEALIAEVQRRTGGGLEARTRFKFRVEDLARERGLSAGVLGLAAARVMGGVLRDRDRWGSAQNLARVEDPNGRARVTAAFLERIDVDALDPLDTAVLRAVALESE